MQRFNILATGLFLLAATGGVIAQTTVEIVSSDYRAGRDTNFDGIFDEFRTEPNTEQFSNSWRNAFEFDLYEIPTGASVLNAVLTMRTTAFDTPRAFEVHWYEGNGFVELIDFARDELAGALTHPSDGGISHAISVTDLPIGRESLERWAGFNVREPSPPPGATFLTMSIPDSFFQPKLVVTYSGGVNGMRFNFDDGTLQGLEHVLSTPSVFEWTALDSVPLVGQVSGEHRLLPTPFNFRDGSHDTLLLRSSPFVIRAGASITFWLTGGRGAGPDSALLPQSPGELAANTSGPGVRAMGVGLYDPGSDSYVLTKQRSVNNQTFELLMFQQQELVPFIGRTLHLDFFDSFAGSWGWIGIDSVSIPGSSSLFASSFE